MQTRSQSAIESVANVAIGIAVALLTQLIVFPLYGLEVQLSDNLQISGWFTLVSLLRSYCVRRFFNRNGI